MVCVGLLYSVLAFSIFLFCFPFELLFFVSLWCHLSFCSLLLCFMIVKGYQGIAVKELNKE